VRKTLPVRAPSFRVAAFEQPSSRSPRRGARTLDGLHELALAQLGQHRQLDDERRTSSTLARRVRVRAAPRVAEAAVGRASTDSGSPHC
jgi:hypothetical protein